MQAKNKVGKTGELRQVGRVTLTEVASLPVLTTALLQPMVTVNHCVLWTGGHSELFSGCCCITLRGRR